MSAKVAAVNWLKDNYAKTIEHYEGQIEANPTDATNYWHLGLAYLLNHNEADAQTAWMAAILDAEEPELAGHELAQFLNQASAYYQQENQLTIAWLVRRHLFEILPGDVSNLLQLLQLSIQQETLSEDDLVDWSVASVFQSLPAASLDVEMVSPAVVALLSALLPTEVVLAVIGAIGQATAEPWRLMPILVPKALQLAYTQRQIVLAIQLIEQYLQWDPENTEALAHLAALYQNIQQYDRGIEIAKQRLELTEHLPDQAFSNHLLLRGLLGAGGYWEQAVEVFQRQEELLLEVTQSDVEIQPIDASRLLSCNYYLAYFRDNFKRQRQIQNAVLECCQETFQAKSKAAFERYQARHQLIQQARQVSERPLRIGYLSHCMSSHSVGWLARWLIQYQDRERFSLYGYFLNPKVNDSLQDWYTNQFDQTRSIGLGESALSMADQIFQDEIDILIDLDSITLDTSCEILALKPAPVQITWLGWDASGLSTIDYFIADPYVITDDAQPHYREKIWRLPQTYIAVDGFEVGVPTLRREDLGIPSDAIVYVSAQRGYKRHADTVRLQMQIIKQVPNSYFLIKGFADQGAIQTFFTEIAQEVGVSGDRLRFLPDAPSESVHRANLTIADVVLDTFPYNGATTTLEALWMERPLVTLVGEQFAARNSYTMLVNAGISEGISWTPEEYINWGVRLGTDAQLRNQVSWKLRQSKQSAPLWDSRSFARQMETTYEAVYQKFLANL
jgi:predicted O-linked N-acetylglucosamine transferase (SPINDLY family)